MTEADDRTVGVQGGAPPVIETRRLSVFAGARPILRDVNLDIEPRRILGIVGPSGAGKSTLLRCLNRLIDLDPQLRVEGEVRWHGRSILGADVEVDTLRARVGILFQQPVVFPTSIARNVLFGVRHAQRLTRAGAAGLVERALREAALWEEVSGRLHAPAAQLSVGQQQRLCLARTLALDPEVILMDEPTSALDAQATAAIEQLMLRLVRERTIVLVTHHLEQAARVADRVVALVIRDGVGEIGACGAPREVLRDRGGAVPFTPP